MMYSNEIQEIVNFRRSNRKFDPEINVPDEILERSLESAILSPNSSNMQLWEFYWIMSKPELERMVPLCINQHAAKTAKAMVVFVNRKDKWKERANCNCNKFSERVKGSHDKGQLKCLDYYGKVLCNN